MSMRCALIFACLSFNVAGCSEVDTRDASGEASTHRAAVERAFAEWSDGTGSPFELLADDMRWTVIGSSPTAGTYDRTGFDALVKPFNGRLSGPLKPVRWQSVASEDIVMIHFTARAPLNTGELYENEYAWIFRFEGNEVVDVRAFLDLPKFERALSGQSL
ncbi:nuclear transport factor 2 family protein [Qipengyuania qiaonensis]|uniref:Nuclear transport factor 2 family protein n=1 Tax=Qipengyuania qiaonensis TaxID=2867240 RepID=A0ABS7JDI8_9SPHN|nr:nuclear transport factor 2 family protein [Qipengyuania qiaonensis]MBX7483899.1 nuclear transport factor 2 family protein [Qipengyuania qiaonensis]